MYCTCTICKIWQLSSTRLHYKELTRRWNLRGEKGGKEKDIVQFIYISETCLVFPPCFLSQRRFIDFSRPVGFFLVISWWLHCRSASLAVVVLQGVSSLTIFLSHMSCENEHLYTNHKYKSFPFWRKEC